MKKHKIALIIALLIAVYFINTLAQDQKPGSPVLVQAQTPFLTPEEKREMRKNLVVKEMNADAKGKRQWMDHLTVWDENGFKLEEIEYAVYGQKERVTFEYDATGKCVRENVYNDKNKLYRIRKYEYNSDGRKKTQYNYNPDGKLYSTKVYEYSYK
jgi:antitoxin component YwqK of YwqJK toxin-antitoxin module